MEGVPDVMRPQCLSDLIQHVQNLTLLNFPIQNFMKILSGVEVFHADNQRDGGEWRR